MADELYPDEYEAPMASGMYVTPGPCLIVGGGPAAACTTPGNSPDVHWYDFCLSGYVPYSICLPNGCAP
jgi:hypothetical protein